MFSSLAEARRIIEVWPIDYNTVRPHSSLGYLTPEEFAAVGAKGLLDAYPRNPKPDTSVPYVMWPDTPCEHVMIPVR